MLVRVTNGSQREGKYVHNSITKVSSALFSGWPWHGGWAGVFKLCSNIKTLFPTTSVMTLEREALSLSLSFLLSPFICGMWMLVVCSREVGCLWWVPKLECALCPCFPELCSAPSRKPICLASLVLICSFDWPMQVRILELSPAALC